MAQARIEVADVMMTGLMFRAYDVDVVWQPNLARASQKPDRLIL